MQHLCKKIFMLLQLFFIPWCLAENSQPYCNRNVTETTYKMVTKTRLKTVTSKNFFKKIISKKDTQVEVYEEQEPVYTTKMERICCEGYKMSEHNLCEPQCVKNLCPQYSRCVEPEVCECQKDYIAVNSNGDRTQRCELACEVPCPENSVCVGHKQCACKSGYFIVGDKCQPVEDTTHYPGYNEIESQSEVQMVNETNTETSSELNGMFEETTETTVSYTTDDYDRFEKFLLPANESCPDDYVFHKGQCRLLEFFSNETDCSLKPCEDTNAICLNNGTCACSEGYKLYTPSQQDTSATANESNTSVCLTNAEYLERIRNLAKEPLQDTTGEASHATSMFFITLGVLAVAAALVLISWKLFHRQTGKIDVEGKNLACAYNHRVCSETEKSVI